MDYKPLSDFCVSITDCPHSTPKWTTSGKLVIRNQYIKNGRLDLSNPSFTDVENFNARCKRAKPLPGDIIITREAPMGEVCIIPAGIDCCLGQRMVLLKPDAEKCDNRYLLYALMSKTVRAQIRWSEGTGTTVSNLRIPHLENLKIPNIPLSEQKAIGATLASLDDRIVINTKLNQHLEQMAQAIFKSWFVDFEPFGGEMPNDWREGTLSEIAEITMGQSPDGKSYNEDGIGTVFYQGRAEFGSRFPTRRLYTTQPKRMAAKGDVLMSVRAPVGDINVASEHCCLGRGLAGIHSTSNCQSFVLYTMFNLKQEMDMYNGEGTVFGSINKNAMANLPVIIPTDEIMLQFNELVKPMDFAIETNYGEVCHLQAIRDSLLPRLMSGELTVGNNR